MKLHNDRSLFLDIISRASEHPVNGGLGIKPQFIEKDYWISNSLYHLSKSKYKDYGILKGGTALSKAYYIGYRFSHNIDIDVMVGKDVKDIIRGIETVMAGEKKIGINVGPDKILKETNSYTYQPRPFKSFIYEYLISYGYKDIIKEFELEPFEVMVLDKRIIMTEELVSLFRFSLEANPAEQLKNRITYFYDLHYLYEDEDCRNYLESDYFKENFISLYNKERELFDKADGRNVKNLKDFPLFTDFHDLWNKLSDCYYKELLPLSFSLTIPDSKRIETSFTEILGQIFKLI